MGMFDSLVDYLANSGETEEEKKKRLAEQLKNNPVAQAQQKNANASNAKIAAILDKDQ